MVVGNIQKTSSQIITNDLATQFLTVVKYEQFYSCTYFDIHNSKIVEMLTYRHLPQYG